MPQTVLRQPFIYTLVEDLARAIIMQEMRHGVTRAPEDYRDGGAVTIAIHAIVRVVQEGLLLRDNGAGN